MTTQARLKTLHLIELVLEERASADDIAQLESFVLGDEECLQFYMEVLQLHGNLYWDAAGCGAEFLLPQEQVQQISAKQSLPVVQAEKRFSKTQAFAVLCSAAVVLLAVVFVVNQTPTPSQPTVAQQVHATTPDVITSPAVASHNANQEQPAHIVGVKLPTNETIAQNHSTESVTETLPNTKKEALFDSSNDEQMVAFIDNQIRSRWIEQNVAPSAKASDSEWLRRVHLDLAGRIPTTVEVETFLHDQSPGKREELLDSLLESRDFASHFASLWTTLLVGRSADRGINREALFTYLQRQFGNNDPWSATVTDLIASDGPADQSGPANFLLAHLNNEAVPATAITTRILLCQQIQCSQCHRHPNAKSWGQEKFWEFNAFFQQTSVRERMLVDQETGETQRVRELVDQSILKREPSYYEDLQGVMKVAYPKYSGVDVQPQAELSLREQLAQLLIAEEDSQLAKAFVNRSWKHFFGFAFTRQVDDMGPHHAESHSELLAGVSQAFVESDYDVRRLLRWICLSEAYHLSSTSTPENELDAPDAGELPLFSRMYVKPLSPEQIFNSLMIAAGVTPEELHRRGRSYAQREKWLQQFFTVIDNEENSDRSTFDGSLPQTLMMMNGDLVKQAVDPVHGQVFKDIISDRDKSETDRINEICLAALSRYPSKNELAGIRKLLRSQVRQSTITRNIPVQVAYNEALRDVYWAYLNSSEFTVNH